MNEDRQTEAFKCVSDAIMKVKAYLDLLDSDFMDSRPEVTLIVQGTLYNLSALRQMIASQK